MQIELGADYTGDVGVSQGVCNFDWLGFCLQALAESDWSLLASEWLTPVGACLQANGRWFLINRPTPSITFSSQHSCLADSSKASPWSQAIKLVLLVGDNWAEYGLIWYRERARLPHSIPTTFTPSLRALTLS
jgi:hypothetical protein